MELIKILPESGIPLIGCIAFGIIDRGTDLIQVRPTSVCNFKCVYCSTNANNPKVHPVNYEVDVDYLLDYVKEVIKYKDTKIECNIDSVGEVMAYPEIIGLVEGISALKDVKRISMQSNGSFLTSKKIKSLENAGMDQINLSINTLDEKLASRLAGNPSYDLKKILQSAKCIAASKIDLLLAPVWLPKTNEMDGLIRLAKDLNARIGIQKYETYRFSRKIKAKPITYWKFYDQLRKWEKEFGQKLILKKSDMGIKKAKRLPTKFNKGEKVRLKAKCLGWWKGQMLAVGRNRVVSIDGCKANPEDLVNAKIVENKNNIYLAKVL